MICLGGVSGMMVVGGGVGGGGAASDLRGRGEEGGEGEVSISSISRMEAGVEDECGGSGGKFWLLIEMTSSMSIAALSSLSLM
jgi:hypothetical protein